MGSSTNIRLPLHVRPDWLNLVVARFAGAEFEKHVFSESRFRRGSGRGFDVEYVPRPHDPSLPASHDNPWYLRPIDASTDSFGIQQSTPGDITFGTMRFRDMCGNIREWYFHQQGDDENHKLLSPGSYGLAVAIGKRVVDVFGGSVVFDDQREKDEPDYRVSNRRALVPRRTKDQSSNDRYYQFENVLANLTPVSSHELRVAIEKYNAGRYDNELLSALASYEKKQTLEKISSSARPEMTVESPPSRKPKI